MSNILQDAYHACQEGNLEKLLEILRSGIDVNYKYDFDRTLLHLASQYGHVTLIKELLNYGADIDSKSKLGYTALHNAVLLNHKDVFTELINHVANINIFNKEGYTAFHLAARNGKLEILMKFLEQNLDINSKSNNGCTPLYLSSENGHLSITKELLKHGADVNLKNNDCGTPLHCASIRGHAMIINELLKYEVDVNAKNKDDNTPLHCASERGHVTIVLELLKHGADVKLKDNAGRTPLHCASMQGHVTIINALLKHEADVNAKNIDDDTPLHCAACQGQMNSVIELLNHGADTDLKNKSDFTPIYYASYHGHVTILIQLLKYGADANIKNKIDKVPLYNASVQGHAIIASELLKHVVDVDSKNIKNDSPLFEASFTGHVTIVSEFLKYGADVNFKNKNDDTPLIYASQNGHMTTVTELIKHGADVNFKNKDDNTPLIYASQNGHVTTVTELIKHGADVNFKNKNDDTSLTFSSLNGHVTTVTELIKHGANVNFKNKNDDTSLIFASLNGHVTIVTELLKHGADVNFKNKFGFTALHFACFNGDNCCITELINYGADVNLKNIEYETPLHIASKQGHVGIVIELLKHGIDQNLKMNLGKGLFPSDSEILYDKSPLLMLVNLKKKMFSEYVFDVLSELCFYISPKYSQHALQLIVSSFKILLSFAEQVQNNETDVSFEKGLAKLFESFDEEFLSKIEFSSKEKDISFAENLNKIIQSFDSNSLSKIMGLSTQILPLDLEYLTKLFGFNFFGEFIFSFQNKFQIINSSSNLSPHPSPRPYEVNLPGIGNIPADELLKIANQFYNSSFDFFKFCCDFYKLFKSTCILKSHDLQNDICKILGYDFNKEIHSAIDMFLEDCKDSPYYYLTVKELSHKLDLQQEIQTFGIHKLLTKIGGTIAGAMFGSFFSNYFGFFIHVADNIFPEEDGSHDLKKELPKLLIHNLAKLFQFPYVKVVKTYESSFCPAELKIQGSGGEGFLIYRRAKSDLDFMYSLKIFNISLEFNKLICYSEAPTHVIIEVTPNLSVCENEQEKEYINKIIEFQNGIYSLNLKEIKQLISDHVNKQLVNFSSDHHVSVKSDADTCFRIEFKYNVFPSMINQLSYYISNFTEFSYSLSQTTQVKIGLKNILNNISGNFYVSQFKWEYFQIELKLCSDHIASNSSHYQDIPSSTKSSDSEYKDFHIDTIIERHIQVLIESINSAIQSLEYIEDNFKFLVIILEDIFYLFTFILISWGLYTIIPVMRSKSLFSSSLLKFDGKINYKFSEIVFLTDDDITQILNIDLSSINIKMITAEQNRIEIYLLSALINLQCDIELFSKNLDKVKSRSSDIQNFQIYKNLRNEISTYWHSTIILHMTELLEIIKLCMQYNITVNSTVIEEQEQIFEVVPGIKFEGWPLIASAWSNRERNWPELAVIDKIKNNGYHVVFKSSKRNRKYDGRLSFSEAERLLCHNMTNDQSLVYYFLKDKFKLKKSIHLTSYHIKSLCFWVFESMTSANKSEDIQIKYIEGIINRLFTALEEHMLPHYFIPEYNLLMDLVEDDYEEIKGDLKDLVENQFIESTQNTRTQTYNRGDTTNIEFLFQLVEKSFYQSIHQYLHNFQGYDSNK